MAHHVIVSFSKETEFEYKFGTDVGRTIDEARRWFDDEFTKLECDVATPTGKILIIDKILNVARYGGQARFADNLDWGNTFARCAATVLGRDLIRIDVENNTIGY